MKSSDAIKIGELAKRAGLTPDTIRFYEDKGLITAGQRSEAGYRLFSDYELEKLLFIQRAKKVGFTLNEISELMELRLHPDAHTCEEVKQVTGEKIAQVSDKIAELERIRQSLLKMHTACDGGPDSAQNCTILQLLDSNELL